MRLFMITVLSLAVLLLSQCSVKEKKKDMRISVNKLYTIICNPDSSGIEPDAALDLSYAVQTDKDGFLYVKDEKTGTVKVFDKNGKYYSSVSSSGEGLEQIKNFNTFYTFKDTVYIFDSSSYIKKFLRTGEYVSVVNIPFDSYTVPLAVSVLNDSTLIGRVSTLGTSSEPVLINLELAQFDKNFRKTMIMQLSQINKEVIYRSYFAEPVFAVNDRYIFVSKRSREEYRIKLYSHTGEFIREFSQDYVPEKFSEKETEVIKLSQMGNPQFKDFFEYKLALHDIKTDRYGYLWVQRSDGNFGSDISFDIFDNDRLILKYTLDYKDIAHNTRWAYLSDRLYVLDHKNNMIDVYGYTIEDAGK